ncbi:MAG: hypothetical protein EXS05_22760 [Planctomycetaceae bacterium]|nr:hypothetical protein [Planctomycetaceae bacterium]
MTFPDPAVALPTERTESRRFSIRLLRTHWLLLATITLIVVGLIRWFGLPIYRQHVAIREIERLGGRIESDKGGPGWLRNWIGDERMKGFDEVDSVFIHRKQFSNEGLAHMRGLANLRAITLDNTAITDAGLVQLQGLTNLKWLSVRDSPITDKGLANLKGLTSLELLQLDGTAITDAGLVKLRGFTNLKILYLRYTRVTDAGVAELKLPDSAGFYVRPLNPPSEAEIKRFSIQLW